jgi:hypothetical protein
MHVSGTIGTRLNAISASDTTVFINKDNTVFGFERCYDRTHLNARGIVALIAKLRDKETSEDVFLSERASRFFRPCSNSLDTNMTIFFYEILFHPRPEEEWLPWNVVLILASFNASTTANTFVYLYSHAIVMLPFASERLNIPPNKPLGMINNEKSFFVNFLLSISSHLRHMGVMTLPTKIFFPVSQEIYFRRSLYLGIIPVALPTKRPFRRDCRSHYSRCSFVFISCVVASRAFKLNVRRH